jgi:2-(1,2-epoxy-1,2-dihydrophenyl)acetyl-CoA isomerase
MARTSRTSNAAVKRLLLGTYRTGIEEQMELEGRYIADCARSADGQEGIAAFVGKRAPAFG